MADLCSCGSASQDSVWASQTLCPGTAAEPNTKISRHHATAGKNYSFLRLPWIAIQLYVPEQLVLPQAMWLFHLVVGFGQATLSPVAAGLNCFLLLIKRNKSQQAQIFLNPLCEALTLCMLTTVSLCQDFLRLLHCSSCTVNQSQLPVHTGKLSKEEYAIEILN